jgi:peptide/nickel transport system permease protein
MLAYVIRRVFQSIFVLLVVGLVAFSMFRFVGDPVETCWARNAPRRTASVRDQLGLNEPFISAVPRLHSARCQGDLGVSYRQGRPVIRDHPAERLPATLELALRVRPLRLSSGSALASSPPSAGMASRRTRS